MGVAWLRGSYPFDEAGRALADLAANLLSASAVLSDPVRVSPTEGPARRGPIDTGIAGPGGRNLGR